MCYMGDCEGRPPRVGVRELRQNLSVYLDRVKAGEVFEVTEHGQPVARLAPRVSATQSILDQMIADGRAMPARLSHRLLPPPPKIAGRPASEILLEMREAEER
jgi:prevent-host-death family protein